MRYNIKIDYERNNNLSAFAKATLADRYLMPDETPQDRFAAVANAFADNQEHAQRLYDYISKQWFTPATPVLSNGGTTKGLPISCFVNEVEDTLESIADTWNESVWLASRGGGIGTNWSSVRSIGEDVGQVGHTSGIIPFVCVQNSLSMAISQGSQRRGSSAAYLDMSHPEIEEFINIRRPVGDANRKALFLHHGVTITNEFMKAVRDGKKWDLISPASNEVTRTVDARELWIQLITTRLETGEPYMLFIDTVNKYLPTHLEMQKLYITTSNLCSEITLPTGKDQFGKERTAVCCLSSVNLEKYDEWKDDVNFIEDILRFLDNVLDGFIDRAPGSMAKAQYAAIRERSVGLGAMGFHSYLQSKGVAFDSPVAAAWNKAMFTHISAECEVANTKLAKEKGPCPDAAEVGVYKRFSHMMAIAPNASTSIICNSVSPGVEPLTANSFTQKTLSGSFSVKNRHLEELLESKGKNTKQVWDSITTHEGSVQHLDFLSDEEKDVFKTAFEVDQRWVIKHAGDRTPMICQSQSINMLPIA